MSTKHFCDLCGVDVTARNYVTDPLRPDDSVKGGKPYPGSDPGVLLHTLKPRVQFEIQVGVGPAWNAGHICRGCLLDAINACDDRARGVQL